MVMTRPWHLRLPFVLLAVLVAAGCARFAAPRAGYLPLTARQVLIVANRASPESVDMARHYSDVRHVPPQQVVMLETGTGYHCTRAEYETQIAEPIRRFLVERKRAGRIRCLVLMWGVPVKIGCQPRPDASTNAPPPEYPDAAVDNELALLWHGHYDLALRQPNPLFWEARPAAQPPDLRLPAGVAWPAALMAARIDGPTAADARRLIDDAAAVEKKGLTGTVYLDAGGLYPAYDRHFRKLAELLRAKTKLKVVLDEKRTLFPPGSCPDTALYAGWYQLCTYVPAFTWNRGSVGWHIASFEAANLRDPNTKEWCAKMIQNGAGAVFGPVSEPQLDAFPLPEEFMPLLLTGRYTIAECYWRTLPHASWQMTLIGDPLYNPYRRNPQLRQEDLTPGLAP